MMLPRAVQWSMERLHQLLPKFQQVVAGPLWPCCACVPLLKSKCLLKPEQVTHQQRGASLQGQHIPCPALHPLPHQCPSTIMAVVPPAAVGLLLQPGDQALLPLLLHNFSPSSPQPGHLCGAELNLSSPESLSNMDLSQRDKPLQSWGLPAPLDLCMAAKPLEL